LDVIETISLEDEFKVDNINEYNFNKLVNLHKDNHKVIIEHCGCSDKTLKDVKKKDDIMQKVREQTALLKKKKHEKEYEDKIHKGLNESSAAYEREISKLEEQVSGV
jgi:hypothetical protein